jgi:hypothetical protein
VLGSGEGGKADTATMVVTALIPGVIVVIVFTTLEDMVFTVVYALSPFRVEGVLSKFPVNGLKEYGIT